MDQSSGAVRARVQQFVPDPALRNNEPTRELHGMLPQAAAIAPKRSKDDPIDKTGRALIAMLHEAAEASNEDYERATARASQLAGELRTIEHRIKELEAEASYFRERSARAEDWLRLIAREIESKLISPGRIAAAGL
jgi:hypothetical protein